MRRVIVYGGGAAALMATAELLARGTAVDLVGPVDPLRWPALGEAGIDAGADPERLFEEALACGGFLAPRAPLRAMAESAAEIVADLERWGVPLQRDSDGLILRRLPGASRPNAAFVESSTTEQVLRALDRRIARIGGELRRFEPFELAALARDDGGRCVGIVAQSRVSMKHELFEADAVVLAAGGPEKLFAGLGALATEGALAVALEAGAVASNADLVQLHPAALASRGWHQPLSAALRSESARLWVPRDRDEVRPPGDVPKSERDYFVERDHPGWGALCPDDLCARAVWRILEGARGLYDRKRRAQRPLVYLDATHVPASHLRQRLGAELDACQAISGIDPTRAALTVTATASGCLGGLWVDHQAAEGKLDPQSPRQHATSIEGLYAIGDSACLYHGLCRFGGAGLLAAIFGARTGAQAVASYLESAPEAATASARLARSADRAYAELLDREGDEDCSAAELGDRLRAIALADLGLGEAEEDVDAVAEDLAGSGAGDASERANLGAPALRDLERMVLVLRAMRASGRARRPEPQPILARLEGDDFELLEAFDHVVAGQTLHASAAVDPDSVTPAPRRYHEEPS